MRPLRLVVLVCLVGGCTSRLSVGLPSNVKQQQEAVGLGAQGTSDLLFMIDNSPSMDAMQTELRAHFGDLVQTLSGLNKGVSLDLHIGVVTSDYGAGDMPGGGCAASPGGQNGLLQARGAAADSGCAAPLGTPFISYQIDAAGNVSSNLPTGQDLAATFTCMASVGAAGCGFEHQLESVYAALHNGNENAGFLRDDATLAVVFLTNEDDGSAPPDAKFYESAADVNQYGAYDTFRQTRFAVECSGKKIPYGDTAAGPLQNCVSAPEGAGLAYDVIRYSNLFTQTKANGGLKDDPSRIALLAIEPPATPTSIVLAQNNSGLGIAPNPTYVTCAQLGSQVGNGDCVERLQHSCQNRVDPAFFGDPAVRIASVVNQAAVSQIWSICGDDDSQTPSFAAAMQGVGAKMATQAAGGCMPAALVTPQAPECTVTIDGSSVGAGLPQCGGSGVMPCWHVTSDSTCPPRSDPQTGDNQSYRLVIEGGNGELLHANCNVYTVSAT